MVKQIFAKLPFLFLALILLLLVSSDQFSASGQLSKQILADLQAFLVDPVGNFEKIKDLDDLTYWVLRYELNHEAYFGQEMSYLEKLFQNNFQVKDMNEKRLDIIFFLLLNYESNFRNYNLIVNRLVDVACSKPDWFFQVLASQPEHRVILKKIEEYAHLRRCLDQLKDGGVKRLINDDLLGNEKEKDMELENFRQFMKDPVGNFDKIKNIDNICGPIVQYENTLIKDGILERFATDILFSDHFQDINEEKISILLYLLLNTGSGVHGELIAGFVAGVFRDYPGLFLMALQKEKRWRSALLELSLEYQTLKEVIGALGDSEFEMEIKRQFEEEEYLYQKIREREKKKKEG